jgi:hypothetical protein
MFNKIIDSLLEYKNKNLVQVKTLYKKDNTKFIVSFPKSGNTWIRAILANLYFDDIDFISLRNIIPGINNVDNVNPSKTGIYTTHYSFFPASGKVLYVVRDPRSVAVSYFYYQKKYKRIDDNMSFESFFYNEFLSNKYDMFGTWYQNVASWIFGYKKNDNFKLIKYEDMLENEYETTKGILKFYELDFDDKIVLNALKKSSFDNLKKTEQKQKNEVKKWKEGNNTIDFFRSGKQHEWKEYFTKEMEDVIFEKFGDLCLKLDYKKELNG